MEQVAKLDWVINMGCQTGQNDIFEPADFLKNGSISYPTSDII